MRGDGDKFLAGLGDVSGLPSRTQRQLADFVRTLEKADRGEADALGLKAKLLKTALRSYAGITTDQFNRALKNIK